MMKQWFLLGGALMTSAVPLNEAFAQAVPNPGERVESLVTFGAQSDEVMKQKPIVLSLSKHLYHFDKLNMTGFYDDGNFTAVTYFLTLLLIGLSLAAGVAAGAPWSSASALSGRFSSRAVAP